MLNKTGCCENIEANDMDIYFKKKKINSPFKDPNRVCNLGEPIHTFLIGSRGQI